MPNKVVFTCPHCISDQNKWQRKSMTANRRVYKLTRQWRSNELSLLLLGPCGGPTHRQHQPIPGHNPYSILTHYPWSTWFSGPSIKTKRQTGTVGTTVHVYFVINAMMPPLTWMNCTSPNMHALFYFYIQTDGQHSAISKISHVIKNGLTIR